MISINKLKDLQTESVLQHFITIIEVSKILIKTTSYKLYVSLISHSSTIQCNYCSQIITHPNDNTSKLYEVHNIKKLYGVISLV
ncbi:hypothetical protein Hanom_Chr09g00759861 [Helianthus anomalus]